ncbi:hypothetical protein D3C76_637480 [compost metagenome]
MHVHAGAGQLGKWLGHEAGLHAVGMGHTFYQALVAHRLVHRLQRIAMLQGDFHLARGVLGNGRARRDALGLAGSVQVGEERFDLLQFAQAIDLGAAWATAIVVQCRLWAALGITLLVKQVELQLAGHHRVVTIGLQRFDGAQQHMAWVSDAGRQPLAGVHAHLHCGGGHPAPGQAHQAAVKRVGTAVDVADVPHQAGVFHVVAIEGQAKDGAGQWPAGLVHGQQFLAVQQLAAWHTVGVEDEQFEQLDIGVVGQKTGSLLYRGKVHDQFAHRRAGPPRKQAAQLSQTARRWPGLVTMA